MMKRGINKRLWALFSLVLMALLAVSPAWAQAQDFVEDFEDSDLSGWERSPDAVVIDGALRITAGNFAFKIGEWQNYTLTLRVRISGTGDVNLLYYARDESRYQLHILPGEMIFERNMGERGEILGAVDTSSLSDGNWINLTLRVVDGVHEVSIEDELVLTVTDTEPLEAGPIGLVFNGEGYAEFDDLTLTQEAAIGGGETPPEGEGEHPPEGEGEQPPEGEGEPPPEGEGEMPPEGEGFPQPELEPQSEEPVTSADATSTESQGWLQEFLSGQAQPVELQAFVINLLLSAVMAFILGRVYIYWGTSLSNRRKFAANFMLITITTTFIILVVRSSVALSLGLVGALSIVRFRAAIKEPEELAYLFFAIGIGIGLGDNQRLITLLALTCGILLIGLVRLFHNREADMNLHLTVASGNPERVELDAVMAALSPHTAKLKLLRFDETETAFESTFLVEFRNLDKMNEARKALRALSSGIEITFMDNRGME
jgi:hypothetical protein